MSTVNDFVPAGAKKFREISADSVMFYLDEHTPSKPHTLTFSRKLPVPRKGNAGAMKMTTNCHINVDIGTLESPKIVPVVVKVDISAPVGAPLAAIQKAFRTATLGIDFAKSASHTSCWEEFAQQGLLPDAAGPNAISSLDSYESVLYPVV